MLYIFQYTLSYKHILIIACMIGSLVGFVMCMYEIIAYFKEYSILGRAVQSVYARLNEVSNSRETKKAERKIEFGEEYDNSILGKIDRVVTYSGITKKAGFIKTEVIIMIAIVGTAVITIVAGAIMRSIGVGFTVAVVADCIAYVVLLVKAHYNYIRVEDQVTEFLGCIENFATTSNDLISILDKSANSIREPIRSAVKTCVREANNSGNSIAALSRLDTFNYVFYCIFA